MITTRDEAERFLSYAYHGALSAARDARENCRVHDDCPDAARHAAAAETLGNALDAAQHATDQGAAFISLSAVARVTGLTRYGVASGRLTGVAR